MATKLEKLAASSNSTQEELWEVAQKDSAYAEIVAHNTAAGSDLLRKIYALLSEVDSPISAACLVLGNPSTDIGLITEIFKEVKDIFEDRDVDYPEQTSFQVLLSKHQNVSSEIIEVLSDSPYYMVRERLAARTDLTAKIAEKLAKDGSRHVREILAGNKYVTEEVLDILVSDVEPSIRLKLALNPTTSSGAILLLVEDSNKTIRLAAETRPASSVE
jgi:hypothetical protein